MKNDSDKTPGVSQHLVGFFNDQAAAVKAYHVLTHLDYSADKITVALSEEKHSPDQVTTKELETTPQDAQGGPAFGEDGDPKSTMGLEGLTIGATAGAVFGAIGLVGASIVLPGAGIIFLGPLAAAAAGVGAGATVGGLFGALIGSGHPEEIVDQYVSQIRDGRILIGVNPRTFAESAWIEQQWADLGGTVIQH